jgi:hypothetical protein
MWRILAVVRLLAAVDEVHSPVPEVRWTLSLPRLSSNVNGPIPSAVGDRGQALLLLLGLRRARPLRERDAERRGDAKQVRE